MILRRSVKRSAELLGAGLLLAVMIFTVLALLSYHQTDPSASTAAAGPVLNWMGRPGAWVAERALFLFGPACVLLLPLLLVFARQLWRIAEADAADVEDEDAVPAHHWVRPIAVLVVATGLICSALSLAFVDSATSLPASPGGVAGLLGAAAVHGVADLIPAAGRGVFTFICGAVALLAGLLWRRRSLPSTGSTSSPSPAPPRRACRA
jgi:S-DNA-T family DNA segregation ATPase FtsK/SpoIIIE